ETAFVFLMGLFGVTSANAAAAALTLLGVQAVMSLLGGLLLLRRTLFGANDIKIEVPARKPQISEFRLETGAALSTVHCPLPTLHYADVPVALLAGGLATRLGQITR